MRRVKQAGDIIFFNIGVLVRFEIIFKLLTLLIFAPLFLNSFDLIMKISGYSYLTLENVFSFAVHPFTLIALVVLILLMTAYEMVDVTTIIVILDCSYQKKKIKMPDAVRISLEKCAEILHVRNIPLAFMMLFLIPFLNVGMASSLITTIKIPGFVMTFIRKNRVLLAVFIFFVVLLAALLLRWIYSLHYFVLEDISFKEALKRSRRLGRGKHIKDVAVLAVIQMLISFFYGVAMAAGLFLVVVLDRILEKVVFVNSILFSFVWLFTVLTFLIFMALSTPACYAGISVLFYAHKQKLQEEIRYAPDGKKEQENICLRKIFYAAAGIALISGAVFIYGIYRGWYNPNIEYTKTTEVTAHRGASVAYPENTMSAFEAAKELGADWIELDVQQIKDGSIIVIHDRNFKRTTGVDKNTWELTYSEVQKLDAGAKFREEFRGERIPLLSEVVEFAKENNIRLNIELKPTGYEKDFEKSVIDIISQAEFEEYCVITSQVYSVLERVKEYREDIQTVYVMSLAYGNITSLKAADHFSVEVTNITRNLVRRVHEEGKELYAWTVNSEKSIQKMMELNVDNIITDNIALAKETIYSGKTSGIINEYVEQLQVFFRRSA